MEYTYTKRCSSRILSGSPMGVGMVVGQNWSQRPKYQNQVVRAGHTGRPGNRMRENRVTLNTALQLMCQGNTKANEMTGQNHLSASCLS